MHATAVIGANFGDEGKGLLTDFLCAEAPAPVSVVRFSGGAQAGHTVVTPGGVRRVFQHYGAGTLAGAPTFLSRFFVANPFLWQREHRELRALRGTRLAPLAIDPDAPLTTPFDMLINQELERARGQRRHGSCGVGINETLRRAASPHHATFARDLLAPDLLRSKLLAIRAEYLPRRLSDLALEPSRSFTDLAASDPLMESYLEACRELAHAGRLATSREALGCGRLVFEGSQGLLLDETHRFFPHVTPARTGLHNVCLLAREVGLRRLDVVYVTRAYMTRHGEGPFPTEDPAIAHPDDTNLPHEFQGSLRFGILDVGLLADSIRADLASAASAGIRTNPVLAVTCLDQAGPRIRYRHGDDRECDAPGFLDAIADACGIPVAYVSHGPSRTSVARRAGIPPD